MSAFLCYFRIRILKNKKTMWQYPEPRKQCDIVEDRFGTKVSDPYRWMEDPDSDETKEFVSKQNAISQPFLSGSPVRDKFHKRCAQARKARRKLIPGLCAANVDRFSKPNKSGEKRSGYASLDYIGVEVEQEACLFPVTVEPVYYGYLETNHNVQIIKVF